MREDQLVAFFPVFNYPEAYDLERSDHLNNHFFWCCHPIMNSFHRAKLFSPFDALKGFDEAIQTQEAYFLNPFFPNIEEEIP